VSNIVIGLALLAQEPAGVRHKPAEWLKDKVVKERPKGEDEEIKERAAHRAMVRNTPGVDVGAATAQAVRAAAEMPVWSDFIGSGAAWECIGPAPLVEAWGNSENSGRVSSIAIDPRNTRRLYLGAAHGGVWKSEDRGGSWNPMSDFEESLSMGIVILDPFNPDIVYVGTGEAHGSSDSYTGSGFLRSADGGKTWERMGEQDFHGGRFGQMVASTKVPGMIIAATTRGLYRTLDGGTSWTELLPGGFQDVTNSVKEPSTYYAVGGTGTRGGVFKSTDNGNSWELLGGTRAPGTFGRPQLAQCRDYPQTVYVSFAVGEGSGIAVYRTDDGGANWVRLANAVNYGGGQLWYDNFLACAPDNPKIVYGGGLTIYRSDDGGENWHDASRSYAGGENTHPDQHCYQFDPHDPKTIYAGCDGGIFVSYDRGDTWHSINNGLATLQFVGMDVDPFNPAVAYGGTQDNGTSRTRGSLKWKEIFFGDGGTTLVDYRRPNRVYTEYVGLAMYRSDDYGDNWDWAAAGIDRSSAMFYSPFELDPNNPDILVAGAGEVWRTTDATQSWTKISGNMGQVSALAIAPRKSEVIYAGSRWGRVWVTPNAGGEWFEVSAGLPGVYVTSIAVDPRSTRTAYATIGGFRHKHVFKTENAGGTWRAVDDNLPDAPTNHLVIDPSRPDDIYVATDVGVFVSRTGGENWRRCGVGLPNSTCERLALNRRTGYLTVATHGRSIWRIQLPGASGK